MAFSGPGDNAALSFGYSLLYSLFLLISASFYKPYGPATSFNAGVVPPLADSLRTAI
jgi:hypothetical protein